jgi:hypothetical protein
VLGIGLLQQLLLVPLGPLIVTVDGAGKQIQVLQSQRPPPAVLV